MNKKSKKIIQEAIKSQLKNEGIWDSISDPIAGAAQGIANIPRGIAGQMRLGQVNSKLKRSASRMQKDWEKTKQYADKKAEKMVSSKNPQIAGMGKQVQSNVQGVDSNINKALQQLQQIVSLGADSRDAGGPNNDIFDMRKAPQHGVAKWMHLLGIPEEIQNAKSSAAMVHNLTAAYMRFLQKGIDPTQEDPRIFMPKLADGDMFSAQDVDEIADELNQDKTAQAGKHKSDVATDMVPPPSVAKNASVAQKPSENQQKTSGQEPVNWSIPADSVPVQGLKNKFYFDEPAPERNSDGSLKTTGSSQLKDKIAAKLRDAIRKKREEKLRKQGPPSQKPLPSDHPEFVRRPPEAKMPPQQNEPMRVSEPHPIPLVNKKRETQPIPLVNKKVPAKQSVKDRQQRSPMKPKAGLSLTGAYDAAEKQARQNFAKEFDPTKSPPKEENKAPAPQINDKGEIQIGNSETGESALYPSKDKFGKKSPKKNKKRAVARRKKGE